MIYPNVLEAAEGTYIENTKYEPSWSHDWSIEFPDKF